MPARQPLFKGLIEYWKALPKASPHNTPLKSDFNPMLVYKSLPNFYIGERLGKYDLHMRLMGEKIELLSRDLLPSRNIFESVPKKSWDDVAAFIDQSCGHPCAGHMVRTVTATTGLVYDLEIIGLPLLGRKAGPDFLVGVADFRQNQEKSILRQSQNTAVNEINILAFLDVGYGVPETAQKLPAG